MFRPVSYNINDIRPFKYSSATAIKTGTFCKVKSHTGGYFYAQPVFPNAAVATIAPRRTQNNTATIIYRDYLQARSWFPVFKEDVDPEVTSTGDATISNNDLIMGFFGSEFEINYSYTGMSSAKFLALSIGSGLTVGTGNRLVNYTGYPTVMCGVATVAIVIGTINGRIIARFVNTGN